LHRAEMLALGALVFLLPISMAHLPISVRTTEFTGIYQGLHESDISIVYPILGLPAFLPPGSDLHLGVLLRKQVPGEWRVEISIRGERLQLAVSNVSLDDGITTLTTTIPVDAVHGLYDVEVRKGEVRDVERHALSVGDLKDRLTLVHITDTHMDAGSFRDRTARRVIHSIDVINLIHPDLVVITGDITTGPPVVKEDARNFAELIVHNLQAPIYFTPGNHDARLPSDPGVGYYAFMNPYPDYAFTFGPVRFISLDHRWEMVGGGALRSSFTQEQLDFLGDELSGTDMKLTTVMFHDHWCAFGIQDYDFTLALAGHNHNNLAYRLQGGSLLLVTGAPPRTDDMIRVIEFGQDRILSCSYHPGDLAPATPTRLVEIEVCPPTGARCYQRLEVRNGLVTGLNASWTFALENPGPGWEPLVIGGSLDDVHSTPETCYYRACFDLPPISDRAVECINMIPGTENAAGELRMMIEDSAHLVDSQSSMLDSQDSPWLELGEMLSGQLASARDDLDAAGRALDEGNWTRAGILYSRAVDVHVPIQRMLQGIQEAKEEIAIHRELGYDTTVIGRWIEEALVLLEAQGLHPSLMDTRQENPTPVGWTMRILELDETAWELADQLGRLNRSIAGALAEGDSVGPARAELERAVEWFHMGYLDISERSLNRIRSNYPSLFAAEPRSVLVMSLILVLRCLVNRHRLRGKHSPFERSRSPRSWPSCNR